jgi:deoxyribodipyrimidine photo-lyase
LRAAGVELDGNYPRALIAHREARERALAAYAAMRRRGAAPRR